MLKIKYCKRTILLLIVHFGFNLTFLFADNYGFSIIKGSKVNLYSDPSTNSKIIKTFNNNELVYCSNISKKRSNDFWFKVKTQNHRNGWIADKSLRRFNKNCYPDKYYVFIIKDHIINTCGYNLMEKNNKIVYGLNFENVKDDHILLKYEIADNQIHAG